MNIVMNGNVYITNYGKSLDELAENVILDEFDCESCDDDLNEDEYIHSEYIDELDEFEDMIEDYVEIIQNSCGCEMCIRSALRMMIDELS